MTFTIRSWDNTNPDVVSAPYLIALDLAIARAKKDGHIAKLRDDETEQVLTVYADETTGKWRDDSPYTAKAALQDAADDIEDR